VRPPYGHLLRPTLSAIMIVTAVAMLSITDTGD